jgi:hypothetical protein
MTWSELVRPPAKATLQQFAGCWLLVFGAWAVGLGWSRHWPSLSLALGGVAVGVGVPGLLWPATVRWLFVAAIVATWPIGWVVSHVVLFVIYHAVFTPLAALFRLLGRDALRLRPQPRQTSYWMPREPGTDPARYFHQF